jgi:hypothetical protein
MEDRILFVGGPWTPNPETIERWPALRVLLSELRAVLPVEFFAWDTRAGPYQFTPWPQLVREQLRPHHHVVDASSCLGEEILQHVPEMPEPPRSIVTAGYFPTQHTAREFGMHELAASMAATQTLLASSGARFISFLMQGANQAYIEAQVRDVEHDLDMGRYRAQWQEPALSARGFDLSKPPVILDVPVLHLSLPIEVAGVDDAATIYRRFVPNARFEQLNVWSNRLHEEEGGRELASHVVPFIKGVMASREKDQPGPPAD